MPSFSVRSSFSIPSRPYHLVLAVAATFFIIGVATKLNFSSLGMWSSYNQTSDQVPGLLAGEPRGIRSDEWLLGVPWLLSQINSNPPLQAKNISVGAETSALLVGLPVRHWSALFRPAQWGFFILGAERGFSWYWMTRSVACVAALTLLFLALTRESLLLSVTGALWIYFSAFTQWWFASVAELLLYFSLACVALRAIFTAPGIFGASLAGMLYTVTAGGFALTLYPPFQVPLFWLGVSILPLLVTGVPPSETPRFWFRVATLAVATVATLAVVLLFIRANGDAVALMEKTVYPGKRLSAGGGITAAQYFAGLFGALWAADNFPRHLGNICEASSFILAWPLALISLGQGRGERRFLWSVSPIIAYLILSAVWANVGAPAWLGHLTEWELVPPSRGIIGWGIGSVIFTVLVIRFAKLPSIASTCGVTLAAIVAVGSYLLSESAMADGAHSLSSRMCLGFGCIALIVAIVRRSSRLLLASVAVLCVYPHALVNPVMRGMSPIFDNPLVKAVSGFDQTRTGRWIVFDSSEQAQLVKATGRKVLNGAQYLPNFWMMKKIDPSGAQQDVYNRYSHSTFLVVPEGASKALYLAAPDAWHLHIDPCGEAFSRLRVDYIVLTQAHPEHRLSCYDQVFQEKTISIYRRK